MATDWEVRMRELFGGPCDLSLELAVMDLLREFQAEVATVVRSFNPEGKAKEKYILGGLPYLFRYLCGDIASEIESMLPPAKKED